MQVLEGTWEEKLEHSPRLAGHRVRVIVEDEAAEQEIDPRWQRFIGAAEAETPTDARDVEKVFVRGLRQKKAGGGCCHVLFNLVSAWPPRIRYTHMNAPE